MRGAIQTVLLRQRIYNMLALSNDSIQDSNHVQLDLYVQVAPNDIGLSLGGVVLVRPPRVHQPLLYLGFSLWDVNTLAELTH